METREYLGNGPYFDRFRPEASQGRSKPLWYMWGLEERDSRSVELSHLLCHEPCLTKHLHMLHIQGQRKQTLMPSYHTQKKLRKLAQEVDRQRHEQQGQGSTLVFLGFPPPAAGISSSVHCSFAGFAFEVSTQGT